MFTRHALCECHNETSSDGRYYRTQCGLTAVPPDIPYTASEIHLNNNNISTITPKAFCHFTHCTLLSLSHNHLTKISKQMFTGLTSVKHLFLDGNQIFNIESGAFSSLQSLVDVRLDDNNLVLLPADTFGTHPVELRLSLGGNPLICNYRFEWVKKGEEDGWLTLDEQSLPQCTNYPDANWRGITSKHLKIGYYH